MGLVDKTRVWWAGAQYDLWLDLYCVPGRTRKGLRQEFTANLTEAIAHVGAREALTSLGGLRKLAAQTSRDAELRSRWLAGAVIGMLTFGVLAILFLLASLNYASGVIDSGVTQPVAGAVFPFAGSWVEAHNVGAGEGLSVSANPGPALPLLALLVFLAVARPWRSLRRSSNPSEARSS